MDCKEYVKMKINNDKGMNNSFLNKTCKDTRRRYRDMNEGREPRKKEKTRERILCVNDGCICIYIYDICAFHLCLLDDDKRKN